MAYHNDTENLLLQVASSLNRAEDMAFLTDATVAAANTPQGLLDAIDAVQVHNDQENWKIMLKDAIKAANFTTAEVADLTTVAGLIALLPSNTSNHVLG